MTPDEFRRMLEEALAPIRTELDGKLTVREVQAMIDVELTPLRKEVGDLGKQMERLLVGQDAHQRIETEVARLSGAVGALTSLRTTEYESLRAEDQNQALAINATATAQAALQVTVRDLVGTLYGHTDRAKDDPSLFQRIQDLQDEIRIMMAAQRTQAIVRDQDINEGLKVINEKFAADHEWIEARRNFEKQVIARSKTALQVTSNWLAKHAAFKWLLVVGGYGSAVVTFFTTNPTGIAIVQLVRDALFTP